jgi:hypothetical protein
MGWCRRSVMVLALAIVAFPGPPAHADEGGVSFWLPGKYSSFAAVTPPLGWSLPLIYYSYGGSTGAAVKLPRGHLLTAGLDASFNGVFIVPTYTPEATVLGAHPSFSVAFAPAYVRATGNVRLGSFAGSETDSLFGGSDLYPQVQLNWNAGVHNFMVYATGDVPVGSYNPNQLANIGIGHGAIDGGGAYTYLNTTTGTEVSATLGFTGNFENPSTHYTNGTDFHLDLGASQFLTKQLFVGVVGYYYQQLTADKGQPAFLGPSESRTRSVGPQIGYNFDLGGVPLFTNLRGYKEFGSSNRLQGYAVYATVSVPLSALLKGK